MKKALVITLIAALSIMLAAVLAGCGGGGQTEEAKALMDAGDEAYSAAMSDYEDMNTVQGELANAAMSGDTSAFTGEAGEAMLEEFDATLTSFESNLGLAKVSYQGIAELEGADDYKEYANLMIDACDARLSQVDLIKSLVDNFLAMVAQSEATGQPLDINALIESEELAQLTDIDEKAEGYEKQAEDIKQEKKL